MEYKNIHKLNSEDKVMHLKKILLLKISFWQNICYSSLRIIWLFALISGLSRLFWTSL